MSFPWQGVQWCVLLMLLWVVRSPVRSFSEPTGVVWCGRAFAFSVIGGRSARDVAPHRADRHLLRASLRKHFGNFSGSTKFSGMDVDIKSRRS